MQRIDNRHLYEQLGIIIASLEEVQTDTRINTKKIDKLMVDSVAIKTNLTNHLAHHKKDLYIILTLSTALIAGAFSLLRFLLK